VAERLVGLKVEEQGPVVVAHVSGELDIAEATAVGDAIIAAVPSSALGLVVDFSKLEFIDSSGVAMLFKVVRHLAARRQTLRVVSPSGEPVARVLEIVEFNRAAPIHGDVESALAAASSDADGR
jgi:anti-anti-sigma factor